MSPFAAAIWRPPHRRADSGASVGCTRWRCVSRPGRLVRRGLGRVCRTLELGDLLIGTDGMAEFRRNRGGNDGARRGCGGAATRAECSFCSRLGDGMAGPDTCGRLRASTWQLGAAERWHVDALALLHGITGSEMHDISLELSSL